MRKLMAISAVMLVAVGAVYAAPANTNIAVWYGTEATPLTYISGDGTIVAQKVTAGSYVGLALTDTNVTVDVTLRTPVFVGQMLIGLVSNEVWIASALTTNSWIKLTP